MIGVLSVVKSQCQLLLPLHLLEEEEVLVEVEEWLMIFLTPPPQAHTQLLASC